MLHLTSLSPLNGAFHRTMRRALPTLVVLVFPAAESFAESDKSQYTLFNPTPKALMREMSTDRPDVTESPYTVDAGHVQVEMDIVSFTRDRSQGEGSDVWNVAPINFKVGLLNNTDIQFIFDSYLYERVRNGSSWNKRSGVGDFTTRLKVNLWGNDGGNTAFGVMPFVRFFTDTMDSGKHGAEGGIILPLAVKLPGEWDMGLMTEFDYLRNGDDHGYHAEFVNSVTFGHGIVGDLSGYVEFCSVVSTETGQDWQGTANFGLTYSVTDDIQLDCGVNIGLTHAADDLRPFVGISWRF